MVKVIPMFILILISTIMIAQAPINERELKRKRTRLMNEYKVKNFGGPYKQSKSNENCSSCRKLIEVENNYWAADKYKKKNCKKICEPCFIKSKEIKSGDRVEVQAMLDQYAKIIGDVLKKNADGTYEIQLLEGMEKGDLISLEENEIQKWIEELVEQESKCELCDNIIFNEQHCNRKHCKPIICGKCYDSFPQCGYCKIFRPGSSFKVKKNDELKKNKDLIKKLEEKFGIYKIEFYGNIESMKKKENMEENNTEVTYIVTLGTEYDWVKDKDGKIVPNGDIILKGDKLQGLKLNENEVNILIPPTESDREDRERNDENHGEFMEIGRHVYIKKTNRFIPYELRNGLRGANFIDRRNILLDAWRDPEVRDRYKFRNRTQVHQAMIFEARQLILAMAEDNRRIRQQIIEQESQMRLSQNNFNQSII